MDYFARVSVHLDTLGAAEHYNVLKLLKHIDEATVFGMSHASAFGSNMQEIIFHVVAVLGSLSGRRMPLRNC